MMRLLVTFWRLFTCEHYTALCSKELETPLSIKERLALNLHHLICTFCRRSRRQMHLIDRSCAKLLKCKEDNAAKLTAEAKERIRSKLNLNSDGG
jgi:hypothetical protein